MPVLVPAFVHSRTEAAGFNVDCGKVYVGPALSRRVHPVMVTVKPPVISAWVLTFGVLDDIIAPTYR